MAEQRTSNSIVYFLEKYKLHLLIVVALVILTLIAIGVSNLFINSYEEKAIVLLENIEDDYQKLIDKETSNDDKDEETENTTKAENPNVQEKLNEIIDKYGRSFAAQKAHLRLGILLRNDKNFEEAQKHFVSATKKKNYLTPLAYSYAASNAEDMNNIEEAKKYYQTIVDAYKLSIVFPKAIFSLGRLNEGENKEENKNAIGFYKTLIDDESWSSTDWASLAKSRLVALGYYNTDTTKLETESEDTKN